MSKPDERPYPFPKPERLALEDDRPPAGASGTPLSRRALDRLGDAALEKALIAFRRAPEGVMARSVRELRRRRPEVFERLGPVAEAVIEIAPTDLPVRFRLSLIDARRPVRVVGRNADAQCAARIAGPLPLLLAVLDGRSDADAAFFSRRLVVTGDTRTVVGLHNTLEAAELAPADLIGAPPALRRLTNALARRGLGWFDGRGCIA